MEIRHTINTNYTTEFFGKCSLKKRIYQECTARFCTQLGQQVVHLTLLTEQLKVSLKLQKTNVQLQGLKNTDRVQTYRMFVGKKFVCFDHTDWNELTGMLQKQQIDF